MKRKGMNLFVLVALMALIAFQSSGCAALDGKSENKGGAADAAGACPPCEKPIPETNAEIRLWYNNQVVVIPSLNKGWIQDGLNAVDRARHAYEIRHNARINARLLMQNKTEVDALRKRDMKKYGNPEGPTFLHLVEKNCAKGLRGDEIYEEIIKSSYRTSPEYNKRFGIKREYP